MKKQTYWLNVATGEMTRREHFNLKIFAYRFFNMCYGTKWSEIKKYKR